MATDLIDAMKSPITPDVTSKISSGPALRLGDLSYEKRHALTD